MFCAVAPLGVLSIFALGEVNVALLPATSVTVTIPLTAVPSVVNDSGLDTDVEETPGKLSAVVKLNSTFVLFHPAALAARPEIPGLNPPRARLFRTQRLFRLSAANSEGQWIRRTVTFR
jgi:hypothetical protein